MSKECHLILGAMLLAILAGCIQEGSHPADPAHSSGPADQMAIAMAPAPCFDSLPSQSPDYPDLIHFLKEITAPYFASTVCHWLDYPIPVTMTPAPCGKIDLADCLVEAMGRWNTGEQDPWFVLDSVAEWGVRLVHFPDQELHPPARAQITRLDEEGRPLRIHIVLGNNYHTLVQRPYAVRALVHELGHALFLWGHSRDPAHILWGQGPPLVDGPSPDERKAAHLWHDLPEGLDLNDLLSGPAASRASWPPGGHP